MIKLLLSFPEVMEKAMNDYDPSQIAKFLLDVSKAFNKYYANVKILEKDNLSNRLSLVCAVKIVLHEGLRLLGIQAPEQM
jgi:arginyl-tRNA synthetase